MMGVATASVTSAILARVFLFARMISFKNSDPVFLPERITQAALSRNNARVIAAISRLKGLFLGLIAPRTAARALLSNRPQNGAWIAGFHQAMTRRLRGPRSALCGLVSNRPQKRSLDRRVPSSDDSAASRAAIGPLRAGNYINPRVMKKSHTSPLRAAGLTP